MAMHSPRARAGWYKVAVLLLPGSSSTSVSVTLATPASGGTVSTRPMALNGGSYTVVRHAVRSP